MKLQKKSVLIRSPDPLEAEKEHTNRKEVQEEQKRRTPRQVVAGTNEEIEMEQKERGEVTVEATESTEGDVDEYYFEDPSNIGIVMLSHTCAMLTYFTGYKVLATSSLPKVPGRSAIPVAQFPDYVRQMQQERDGTLEEEYKV